MPVSFAYVSLLPTIDGRGGRASSEIASRGVDEAGHPDTSAPQQVVATPDEEPVDCCVCLERTEVFTPCAHPLCKDCEGKLRQAVCPLCRRALTLPSLAKYDIATPHAASSPPSSISARTSANTLPAIEDNAAVHAMRTTWHPGVSSRSQPHDAVRGRRVGSPRSVREGVRREAPPRLLLQCELGRFRRLHDALLSGEELAAFMPGLGLPGRGECLPYQRQRVMLSGSVAELIGKAPLAEVVTASLRLHRLLSSETLIPVVVLPAVRDKVRHAVEDGPAIREFAWADVRAIVSSLNRLRELEMFSPFVEGVARKVAKRVAEAVKLTVVTSPAAELLTNYSVLDAWPAAHRAYEEVGENVRSVMRQRLLAAAKRFSSAAEASAASSSSSAPPGSPLLHLVETMSALSICGLLDHRAAVEACDALVPGLVREGVKTAATLNWAHAESGIVVARQLATHLTQQPENICYDPEGRVLVFNCRSSLYGSATLGSGGGAGNRRGR